MKNANTTVKKKWIKMLMFRHQTWGRKTPNYNTKINLTCIYGASNFYFLDRPRIKFTSSPTKSVNRQTWANKSEISMFMWMKRPWLMILKMAKIRNVTIKHPINTKQAVLVTPSANIFSFSSISGIGLGVGVVGGGTIMK